MLISTTIEKIHSLQYFVNTSYVSRKYLNQRFNHFNADTIFINEFSLVKMDKKLAEAFNIKDEIHKFYKTCNAKKQKQN